MIPLVKKFISETVKSEMNMNGVGPHRSTKPKEYDQRVKNLERMLFKNLSLVSVPMNEIMKNPKVRKHVVGRNVLQNDNEVQHNHETQSSSPHLFPKKIRNMIKTIVQKCWSKHRADDKKSPSHKSKRNRGKGKRGEMTTPLFADVCSENEIFVAQMLSLTLSANDCATPHNSQLMIMMIMMVWNQKEALHLTGISTTYAMEMKYLMCCSPY